MSGTSLKQAVRLRMTQTGEKYTTALRALEADPAELARLKAEVVVLRRERKAAREAAEGSEPARGTNVTGDLL